jgi:hypothetical protein
VQAIEERLFMNGKRLVTEGAEIVSPHLLQQGGAERKKEKLANTSILPGATPG